METIKINQNIEGNNNIIDEKISSDDISNSIDEDIFDVAVIG
jgi:hypothetical protein